MMVLTNMHFDIASSGVEHKFIFVHLELYMEVSHYVCSLAKLTVETPALSQSITKPANI